MPIAKPVAKIPKKKTMVEEKEQSPPNPPKKKEEGLQEFVLEPFQQWYDFTKLNWKGYWWGLLKIALTSFFVSLILFALLALSIAGIFFAAGGIDGFFKLGTFTMVAVALLMFVILVAGIILITWIRSSISFTSIIYTNSRFTGTEFSIWDSFNRIKGKVFRYLLIIEGAYAILLLPIFLILGIFIGTIIFSAITLSGSANALFLLIPAIFLYLFLYLFIIGYSLLVSLVSSIFRFFAQFWGYGFLLSDTGLIDALKGSFRIVWKKPLETIAFCILWFLAASVASLPLSIFAFFINLSSRLIYYVDTGLTITQDILLILIILFVGSLISLVLSTIAEVVSIPLHYLFWKKVKGKTDTVQ